MPHRLPALSATAEGLTQGTLSGALPGTFISHLPWTSSKLPSPQCSNDSPINHVPLIMSTVTRS